MSTVAAIRIGPADNGRSMTLEEFMEAEVEEGFRYELARGVIEVTKVPRDAHRQVVTNLYDMISQYRRTHRGVVLSYGGGSEFQLWLPGMVSGRNPDLGVVLHGTPKDRNGRRNPVLVAEVVSEESIHRDYETKREEYLRHGILEYWIVDPLKRQVTILTRDGDVWRESILRDQQTIDSMILPGLGTIVSELWADVEEDEPADLNDDSGN